MRAPARLLTVLLPLLVNVHDGSAVEVREGASPGRYSTALARAYEPCATPNTVAWNGEPACMPARTSTCRFVEDNATFDLFTFLGDEPDITAPRGLIEINEGGVTEECRTGTYRLLTSLRVSGDASRGDPACPSGICTFEDVVSVQDGLLGTFSFPLDLPKPDLIDPSFEVLGVTIIAPDGLPMAGAGLGPGLPDTLVSNLTAPYAPCTAPDPGGSGDSCDLVPWSAPCDYEHGEVAFRRESGTQSVRARLFGVAGSSPLCTTGSYRLEATLRPTVRGCGDPFDLELCTLVDRVVSFPLEAAGAEVDGQSTFDFGFDRIGETHVTEILAARVVDPTGAVIGTMGVGGVRSLITPDIKLAGDRLKVKTMIPIEPELVTPRSLDPTLGDTTVTLSDQEGVIYTVTIPPDRWQLQPPVGARWTYRDSGGVLNGVRKAQIKRVTRKGVLLGYRLELSAVGVDLSGVDFPAVTLRISTGRPVLDGPLVAQRHHTCTRKGVKMSCK